MIIHRCDLRISLSWHFATKTKQVTSSYVERGNGNVFRALFIQFPQAWQIVKLPCSSFFQNKINDNDCWKFKMTHTCGYGTSKYCFLKISVTENKRVNLRQTLYLYVDSNIEISVLISPLINRSHHLVMYILRVM